MNQREIEQYLIDFHNKDIPRALKRDLVIARTGKIKAIIGPRRAGKTFYLYQLMKELKENKKQILFLNFENTKLFDVKFKEIEEIIKINERLVPESDKPVLFLDEPQNVDFWERAVRQLFDEGYNMFISGSSSKLLSKEIFTSLRGRSLSYLLLPFSFKEFMRVKNYEIPKLVSSEQKLKIRRLMDEYLSFGGFPEVALEKNEEQKIKNLESYFELTVYKDLVERHKIRDATLIKWLIRSLTSSYTKELSINKVYLTLKSQGRKVSKDELYAYYAMIEDSFFAFYLPKFSHSIRKRESINKVYLCDVGFTKLIETNEDIGKKMENTVYLELLREKKPTTEFSFWKNVQQEEVDFVIKEGKQIKELLQVCKEINDGETKQREVRALLKAGKELNCGNLCIITEDYENEEEARWLDLKAKVKCIPLWKWLLEN